jgi:hypothetical protein
MRAARHTGDGADGPARQDHRIGAALAEILDDLLDRHQRALRRQHGLLLHADDAFDQHVAGAVGLERVDHRRVRADRRHRRQPLAGERTGDVLDVGVHLRQVDSEIAAKHRKRQPGRARLVGIGHGGVRMLLDRDRNRPAILVGVAETVQRSDAGIADPGEHELVGASHADELIVDEVGRHPDQGQMPAALADDLVSGREWDQMGEAFHGHRIAIPDGRFHGLGQRQETRHADTFQ